MIWQAPNLAREPFLNQRPLVRATAALAFVALALTAWNVTSYLRAGSGAAHLEAEIEKAARETDAARARLTTIERDLAAHDLAAENRRAAFLNERIEERTFSWNRLFTRLAEAEPRGVRVRSLSPSFGKDAPVLTASGRRAPVALAIQGEAEDGEALLEFIDRLFEHPAFDTPKLSKEAHQAGGGLTSFSLSVTYLPEAEPQAARKEPDAAQPTEGLEGIELVPEDKAAPDDDTPEVEEGDPGDAEPDDEAAPDAGAEDGEGGG